jgi:antitoxin (DNA-binding transcriptional repressor) of toxin-antitoxin stability system
MSTRKRPSVFNVAVAKARFSELVGRAMSGDEVVIAKENKPIFEAGSSRPPAEAAEARLRKGASLDRGRFREDTEGLRRIHLMRLLLDTHAFLWWIEDSRDLSSRA